MKILYWGILTVCIFYGCAIETPVSSVIDNDDELQTPSASVIDNDYELGLVSYSSGEKKCKLIVKPTPPDSRIEIMDIKPKYYPSIPLSCGEHEILVEKAGYLSFRQWIEINRNTILELSLEKSEKSIPPHNKELGNIIECLLKKEGYLQDDDSDKCSNR